MIQAVFWPDVVRFAAIVSGCMALALFPATIVHRIHGWRSTVVALVLTLMFAALITSTWQHLGAAHIRWYRSPVLLVASILALVYVVSVRGWTVWKDPD